MRLSTILRMILAAAVLGAVAACLVFLPVPEYLVALLKWIHSLGFWGAAFLVALEVLCSLLLLPTTVVNLTAGFLFGVIWGTVTASLGSVLGAMAAFLVGRMVAQDWVDRRVASHPRFVAIDRAIGSEGLKIVILVRLCSLFPFGLTSYLFGVTRVSLGRFALGSLLGRLPATVVSAYIGSTAKTLADLLTGKVESGAEETVLLALGLVALVVAVVVLVRTARRKLQETLEK